MPMDCLNSIAPTDEQLLAFALDGDTLSETTRNHLEQCQTCQRRLARYEQAYTYLLSHLYRSQCPSGEQLSLYCAGLLPDEDRINIANHVLDCPLCAIEVAETRSFLQEQDIELPVSSFSPRALARRIFATRVMRPQLQFAVRGDESEAAWPRQYKAESVDISLHLSRTSSGEHMLLGILTSTDLAESVEALEGIPAELYSAPWPPPENGDKTAATPLLRTQVDDLGNIVFRPVPAGEYVMVIYLPNRELVIEGLTMGSLRFSPSQLL
jgi:hypothetical protein